MPAPHSPQQRPRPVSRTAQEPSPGGALLLAPDVFAAQVGADVVLLDLPRSRYLCLADVVLQPGRRVEGAAPLLAELVDAGLVTREVEDRGIFPRSVPPPGRSLAPSGLRARDIIPAQLAIVDALTGYFSRPLPALVNAAARGRASGSPAATGEVVRIAAAFQAYAPYLPLSAKCLLRSFLLLQRLRAGRCDAVWVFGVRTWPFSAHCWLQAEDLVLDDHWERVAGYTPILAI